MGDPQPPPDALAADPLRLTPEEAVHLLRADCRTTIRPRHQARVDAGPTKLSVHADVIASPKEWSRLQADVIVGPKVSR